MMNYKLRRFYMDEEIEGQILIRVGCHYLGVGCDVRGVYLDVLEPQNTELPMMRHKLKLATVGDEVPFGFGFMLGRVEAGTYLLAQTEVVNDSRTDAPIAAS